MPGERKTIHFIAGMPRAGSTILGNILAQNPRFHVTPTKPGPHQVSITAKKDDASMSARFTVHVATWPAPDFDEEEKKNAEALASVAKGGRRVVSE